VIVPSLSLRRIRPALSGLSIQMALLCLANRDARDKHGQARG
jgi:hypothetical protein